MKKASSRLLAALMVLVMTLGVIPVPVLAAEAPKKEEPQPILYLDMENIQNGLVTNKADNKQFQIHGTYTEKESPNGTKALCFDGSTYIKVGTDYQPTQDFTASAWMWVDSSIMERARMFGSARSTIQEPDFNLNVKNDKTVWYSMEIKDSETNWGHFDSKVKLNDWQLITLVRKGAELTLYLDGVKMETKNVGAGKIQPYEMPLLIGTGYDKDGNVPFAQHTMKGAMDELRLYNQALTDEQIAALAQTKEVEPEPEPEHPQEDNPYLKQDGTPAYGVNAAIQGKRHWLENTDPMPVTVQQTDNSLVMENGAIRREFVLPAVGGTNFYTKSYKNTYIEKELMTGESFPEVYLGLYDQPYGEVYDHKTIKVDPDYYFVGGSKDPAHTFFYKGCEISETCEKPFEWEPRSKSYSDPAASEWPAPGKHVEFTFGASENFPASYKGIEIKVIYEMYDNCAAMKKRVEITNTGDNLIMVGRLAPEALHGNKNMDDLLYLETTYTCGADGTVPIDNPSPCLCSKEKAGSPFEELSHLCHSCYDLGPAYELHKGESLKSFDTYEVVYSTYWFEQQSTERLGFYRKLFPWITDNPLTMHNTGALTKNVIDHAASAGFEMIIQSYSAPDQSEQMLSRNQETLDWYKEMIEYAHSKGVEIGIYQAQYTRDQYHGGAQYGDNGMGTWGTWCLASAAFDDYWDNFKYFVKYTGVDCVEIDGPYPGCACDNGEEHVNQDKETDPDPEGADRTIGDASKYKIHHGYFDSKVMQWENAVRLLCAEFRNMGVYIKVPAWYYLNGGNKCGIGYEEVAWSQPRQEQLLYARQLMHNASYVRTMTMSWSHLPFAQYHGGGSVAMFTPFKDHLFDYNWVIAQTIGNGIASDYRGTALYDEASLPILQRWVNFYNRYRGIVNSDMIHIAQAAYDESDRTKTVKLDTLYHVNANNHGEKGLLWVYNQSDETRTETITVPMYYTGLTDLSYPPYPVPNSMGKNVHRYGAWPPNYSWLPKVRDYEMPAVTGNNHGTAAFVQEGVDVKNYTIDSNGNVQLTVTMAPMSFTYFAIYNPTQVPRVEVTIDAVTGLKAVDNAAGNVELTWNAETPFTVKENGTVVEKHGMSISGYAVYRNGELLGTTLNNTFKDRTAMAYENYQYTVKAMVGSVEGKPSEDLAVQVAGDDTAPELIKTSVTDNQTIVLTFSEAMNKEQAEKITNYTLTNGQVNKAVLSEDGCQVTLTVSVMELLREYTLKVSNLTDASRDANPLPTTEIMVVCGYLGYYPMDGVKDQKLEGKMGAEDAAAKGVTYTAGTGKMAVSILIKQTETGQIWDSACLKARRTTRSLSMYGPLMSREQRRRLF